MSVAIVLPVFVPNNMGFETQIKSLTSLFVNMVTWNRNVDIYLNGWCKIEDYWKDIIDLINEFPDLNICVSKEDRNYGKAVAINNIIKKYGIDDKYTYMLTADSDIIFYEQNDYIGQLMNVAYGLSHVLEKPFGMMSLAQDVADCQLHNEFDNNLNVCNHTLKWANLGGGIAGGCLFISLKAWKDAGGYRKMGVYDGDDGFLLADINKAGYFTACIETLHVIHPSTEIKVGYSAYKAKMREQANGSTCNYDYKLMQSDEFWNN